MKIQVSEQDGVKVVRLEGELVDRTPELGEGITDIFAGPGTRIVVDASGVGFMNSTGLGELVRVNAQANVQEVRMVIAAPSNFVAGVLQTTRLNAFFEVYASVEAAVAELQ